MKYNRESRIGMFFHSRISCFNYDKYWKMRDIVVHNKPKRSKFIRLLYLLRLKKMEARNASSFGTAFGAGAIFASHPILPHGITGSFISHSAKIGKNCTIMQNVIIGSSKKEAPTIGNNCIIGAGAIIIGGITIGNNCRIGAGCVISKSVPDNCTVIQQHPRIIQRSEESNKDFNWKF